MKKRMSAEDFKAELVERGLTIAGFSRDAGLCRTTVHKWLKDDRVPIEALAKLRLLYSPEKSKFQKLLDQASFTLEGFCKLTGTPRAAASKWQCTNSAPEWAIVVLKQKLIIKKSLQLLAESKTSTTSTKQTTAPTDSKAPPVAPNNDTHTDTPQNTRIDPWAIV